MKTHTYTVHYQYFRDGDREGYNVIVPALPGCITWGRTLEEARLMAYDAIRCYLEGLIKDGDPIPDDLGEVETVKIEKVSVPV